MVKTTYAFTLFTAVSLAAPVQQLARDGTGNFIGAGDADGAMNQAVGKIFKDLSPRDTEGQGSGKHRNIIDGIPIVNTLLGNKKQQRDMSEHEAGLFGGDLSHYPIIGGLLGGNKGHKQSTGQNAAAPGKGGQGHQARDLIGGGPLDDVPNVNGLTREHHKPGQNYGQNYGQNEGQNAGQNEGQNEGQNAGQNLGQNGGQNGRRSLTSGLSDLPIVGKLLGGDKDDKKNDKNGKDSKDGKDGKEAKGSEKESHQHDKRQTKPLHGLTGLLHGLTSGSPQSQSHKRDVMGDISDAVTGAEDASIEPALDLAANSIPSRRDVSHDEATPTQPSQTSQATSQATQSSKPSKKPTNPLLKELAGKNGLGALFGGAHHGVGLLPMNGRRDAGEIEARAAPIQGSTLTDVLLNGGALGKITKALSPKPAAPKGGKGDGKGADGKAGKSASEGPSAESQGKGSQGSQGAKGSQGSQGQSSGNSPSGGH